MKLGRLILGTAGIGGIWGTVDAVASVECVLMALEQGVEAIDTAPAYAHAETYVGEALRQWKGRVPSVSSKAGRLQGLTASDGRYDYSRDAMFRSVETSLKKLGLSALDVLFLHDPAHIPQSIFGKTVDVMTELKEKGYAKTTGLGGNPPGWAWPWLREGVFDVLMEYNRLNACNTAAIETSLPASLSAGMRYFAASPLNMGVLGRSFHDFSLLPPDWLPEADVAVARKLHQLAAEEGMELRAMAHRFLLSIPYPFNIVIGPSNPRELSSTLGDFAAGPLPEPLFGKILHYSKDIISR
ncbi:aldo/keto reductase [Chitinophaga sp. GCM10012297]|uniref:Aldo/keto reductase n=1 Tax=Chitinophaga chungangae TaxID=2821488 RepID=A0ABS3YH61_9BACT|nr:aldo/keto reductase [Chitinophaga chungangae]MBO9153623.1 aldo/keto reductase [Chitinophaga chungangae]